MKARPHADRPGRVLVRGVNWLGDAVMTTPALLRLRQALPDTRITLLTPHKLADLWTGHPAVNSLLTVSKGCSLTSVARQIRAQGFDAGLVLPNSHRAAVELWLGRVPTRIGVAVPWRNWLLTRAIPPLPESARMRKRTPAEIRALTAAASSADAPARTALPLRAHQIHHYLHLAAAFGANPEPLAPAIAVSANEIEAARRKFGLDPGTTWLGLNPGAEYGPAKRWPAARFAATAIRLQRALACRWLLLGGGNDRALVAEVEGEIRAGLGATASGSMPLNLAGSTTLRELCAVLKICRSVLTNDTGPMHVAAAVGTPVVVPFGSTEPALTGPGLPGDPRHRLLRAPVPCAPCFLRQCPIDFRCMDQIPVEEVVAALRAALG